MIFGTTVAKLNFLLCLQIVPYAGLLFTLYWY